MDKQTPWYIFAAIVLVVLAIDLWSYRRHEPSSDRKNLLWTVVWIVTGLLFGVYVWMAFGAEPAHEYYAAYAMEKALSLDNLFLFYVIFRSLKIPEEQEHRVLVWGVLGAVVFRGLFIFLGVEAMERWHWVTWIFGAILLYAAWKAFREDPSEQEGSKMLDWLSAKLPIKKDAMSDGFFSGGSATPLLVALVAIELTDVVFAIDSVPAALSVTHDRFVVYSSNIFAILGLRALYLYASTMMQNLPHLHYGLAAVLAFAAIKMLIQEWIVISPLASVAFVVVAIGISVVASLKSSRRA